MSRIKTFCGVIAAAIIFFASTFCGAAPEDSANAKLARIEIDTYGAEQVGALLDRISRLEKSYSGENSTGNMNARIDAIFDALYDNSTAPSILSKVNALEWNINNEVRSDGLDKRLEILELAILGTKTDGTFNDRIRELAKASFGDETLPIAQVQLPANVLIKVETTAPVSSKNMQEGDTLPFRVVEDVYVNGSLVFVRGLSGEGTVVKIVHAKNIFSNGKLEVDFHTLKAIDGQSVKTFAGVEAVEEMKKYEMARGLSLNGYTFSGKTGGIEEVFIRGKNIELDAGVELYVQIKEPVVVYGLKVGDDNSSNVNIPQPTPQPVTENPPLVIEQQPIENVQPPVTETQPQPPINEPEGLADDEKIATPPPPPPVEQKPEPKPVETKPEPKPVETKPEPKPQPTPQPEPTDGDNLEIIEIYDEE